jgi:hypothetical protein
MSPCDVKTPRETAGCPSPTGRRQPAWQLSELRRDGSARYGTDSAATPDAPARVSACGADSEHDPAVSMGDADLPPPSSGGRQGPRRGGHGGGMASRDRLG